MSKVDLQGMWDITELAKANTTSFRDFEGFGDAEKLRNRVEAEVDAFIVSENPNRQAIVDIATNLLFELSEDERITTNKIHLILFAVAEMTTNRYWSKAQK